MAVLTSGQRLSDRYLLDRCVGSMGVSQVWVAHDELLGRPVAVKTVGAARVDDPSLLAAIHREARTAASISHPHVAQVYDFGEAELPDAGRALPYLVMELLEGETLTDRLRDGALTWPAAVRMAAEVAGALAAAHEMGVVHGDIHAGNVMLTAAGAKVADFGIWCGEPAVEPDVAARGNPAFLAPEVLSGQSPTPAADVYSLGVLLYAGLSGRAPFEGGSHEDVVWAHRLGTTVPPPQVVGLPPSVSALCAQCLAPAPDIRPSSHAAATVLRAAVRPPVPGASPAPRGRAPVIPPRSIGVARPQALARPVGAAGTAGAARPRGVARPVRVSRPADLGWPRPVARPAPRVWRTRRVWPRLALWPRLRAPLAAVASVAVVVGLAVAAVAAYGSSARAILAAPPASAPVAGPAQANPAVADPGAPDSGAPDPADAQATGQTPAMQPAVARREAGAGHTSALPAVGLARLRHDADMALDRRPGHASVHDTPLSVNETGGELCVPAVPVSANLAVAAGGSGALRAVLRTVTVGPWLLTTPPEARTAICPLGNVQVSDQPRIGESPVLMTVTADENPPDHSPIIR